MGIPYAEVIGDPIAHSKSPLIHEFWLAKLGIEGNYRATRVAAIELGDYFRARLDDPDWRGCNISMPHKLAVRAFVPFQQDPSFPPWPINLAFRGPNGMLTGEQFDTAGFIMSLMKRPAGPPSLKTALILGAGSAARLVAWGLAHFSCATIWICNRDTKKAARLVEDYAKVGARLLPLTAMIPPVDMVVNATPLGAPGMPEADVDLSTLPKHALIYDLLYVPAETGLLKRARAQGFETMNGLSMLIEQAAPSFRRLFGVMAPREHDAELRELLTS